MHEWEKKYNLTDHARGKFRADVAEIAGLRRTHTGAWVVNGRRFRTMTLAICYVNEMLFDVLLNR